MKKHRIRTAAIIAALLGIAAFGTPAMANSYDQKITCIIDCTTNLPARGDIQPGASQEIAATTTRYEKAGLGVSTDYVTDIQAMAATGIMATFNDSSGNKLPGFSDEYTPSSAAQTRVLLNPQKEPGTGYGSDVSDGMLTKSDQYEGSTATTAYDDTGMRQQHIGSGNEDNSPRLARLDC